jgi:hypothetical protein
MNGWWGHLIQFLGVVAVVVSATLWLQGVLHTIDTRLVAMEVLVANRWTRTDMKLWTQELKLLNQEHEVEVPEVRTDRLYLPRPKPR